MVVVKLQSPSCSECILHYLSHGDSAVVQHLFNTTGISFERPLFSGQFFRELGSVLGNEDKSDEVDMREHLSHGRAARYRFGFQ